MDRSGLKQSEAVPYGRLGIMIGKVMAPVVELNIEEAPNQHGLLSVTATVEEQVKDYILFEGKYASLLCAKKDEDGMEPLFQGRILQMKVRTEGDAYYLFLTVITDSFLMDSQVHNCSFQDIAITSHQMIKLLMDFYPGSQMLISIPDQPVGQISVLYQETIWDFLKRFLSRYGACLYVDSTRQGICLRIGLQEVIKDVEWDRLPYVMKRDTAPTDVEKQLKGQLVYKVEAYDILPLGAQVLFHGKELYIGKVYRGLKNGLLVSQYHLYFKEGLGIKPYYNPNISGASINGVVTNIQRNQVQVQMETDALTSCESQYLFPFSSVAASPDGSGWYCMPKAGDPVRIFFPVSDEREGYAISSIQGVPSPTADSPMGNPDLKDITAPDGKMVKFIENGILLSVGGGQGSITLTNDGKAAISTEKSVLIGAGEEVKITTDGELKLSAGVKVTFASDGGSSMNLTEDTIEANASVIWNN